MVLGCFWIYPDAPVTTAKGVHCSNLSKSVSWAHLSSGWDIIENQEVLRPEGGYPIPTRLKVI